MSSVIFSVIVEQGFLKVGQFLGAIAKNLLNTLMSIIIQLKNHSILAYFCSLQKRKVNKSIIEPKTMPASKSYDKFRKETYFD